MDRQNGADVDIKVYPNGDRLLVADSNEIVSEVYIKPALHEKKIFLIKNIDSLNVASASAITLFCLDKLNS